MINLSVIILSFNTADITKQCLDALVKSLTSYPQFKSEIIVVDNASQDGSQDMIRAYKQSVNSDYIAFKSISNRDNEGYPKGNNRGLHNATGEYVLFLNSDVMVGLVNWPQVVSYMKENSTIGALTLKVQLPNNSLDPASHRGFPTIWNSLTYFTKLEKITYALPQLRETFGGYHMTYKDLNSIHPVDAISGAFFISPKKVLDELRGFDEEFFMYGEDVDLAYRMKQEGYQIMYYPKYTVTHLKYQSGLKNKQAQKKTKEYFYNAMRIFYRKHYEEQYSWLVNKIMYLLINIKSRI
ncbi:MAG: glycosyltransferase family 2 protein [bacterium]|nr:glycosyltransferase family 2 protein [bacterium]